MKFCLTSILPLHYIQWSVVICNAVVQCSVLGGTVDCFGHVGGDDGSAGCGGGGSGSEVCGEYKTANNR